MASAYKCDRCGSFYESFDRFLYLPEDPTDECILQISRKGRYSNAHDKCFDLCPECYKKFVDFLFLKEERSEVKDD